MPHLTKRLIIIWNVKADLGNRTCIYENIRINPRNNKSHIDCSRMHLRHLVYDLASRCLDRFDRSSEPYDSSSALINQKPSTYRNCDTCFSSPNISHLIFDYIHDARAICNLPI